MTSQTSALMKTAGVCGISRSEVKTVSAARAPARSRTAKTSAGSACLGRQQREPSRPSFAGPSANKGWAVFARHHRGLVFMARLDLDASNHCVHRASLKVFDGILSHEMCAGDMPARWASRFVARLATWRLVKALVLAATAFVGAALLALLLPGTCPLLVARIVLIVLGVVVVVTSLRHRRRGRSNV